MKQYLYSKIVFAIFILTALVGAQTSVVSVSIEDKGISQYQSIYLADFDFLQVGATEELFVVTVSKTPGAVTDAVMRFDFLLDGKSVAFVKTQPFSMPAGAETWSVTNIDLSQGKAIRGLQSGEILQIRIEESGVEDVADDIQNEILATSQLPVGLYQLLLRVNYTPEGGQPQEIQTERSFAIQNPTLINLVSPGFPLNSGGVYKVYTNNPIFQWNGNSGDYQLLVFKKQEELSTIDDILNSVPIYESPRLQNLAVQYPVAGAYPLQFGETYVWLVKSFIQTSSGENEVISEVWEFTYVDPAKVETTTNIAKEEFEDLLRQLLGDNAEDLIRNLSNYNMKSVRVNGSVITVEELYNLLEKYRDKSHTITDLILR